MWVAFPRVLVLQVEVTEDLNARESAGQQRFLEGDLAALDARLQVK